MAQEDRFSVDVSRPAHTDRLPALLLGYGVALLPPCGGPDGGRGNNLRAVASYRLTPTLNVVE